MLSRYSSPVRLYLVSVSVLIKYIRQQVHARLSHCKIKCLHVG